MKKIASILIAPFAFITKYFKACVFLLIVVLILISTKNQEQPNKDANLAKIYLQGPILDSASIYEQIKKINQNPKIKGALLLINSPGGAISASVEISDMIKDLNLKIPVVAYVQGTMASGSYYGGMYATKIYANRGAMIGSIGVIFNGVNLAELMDKIGIKTQTLAMGAYKEIGTPTRKWNPKEEAFLKELLQEEYKMFIDDVADARNLNAKNYQQFAEGKVFSARNAKKLGLIDEIGTLDDAIATLQDLAQVENPIWLEKSKFDAYLEKIINSSTQIILQNFTYKLQ
ncbi:signal peptide peptidase SppA [Helicobacter anseris]|uniref:Signal peptide peptidase SppA n=1 Tax=Helicobacter anseris TaxID=375926 RepID=A0A3D8JB23_9HELI|nr:signal peptide peptidase SppA [Helicobacter anseris]RDU74064.1 signal peptide peptidase SppA [Helicobacter anseris]